MLAGDAQDPRFGDRSTEEGLHPSKVLLQPGLRQDPSVPGCHRGCQGHCSHHHSSAQLPQPGCAPTRSSAGSQASPAPCPARSSAPCHAKPGRRDALTLKTNCFIFSFPECMKMSFCKQPPVLCLPRAACHCPRGPFPTLCMALTPWAFMPQFPTLSPVTSCP